MRDRCVGERDVGQRVPILNQCHNALIRDRTVGQKGRWTTSTTQKANFANANLLAPREHNWKEHQLVAERQAT
jgi:uncharacterized caspase-like protein